MCDMWKNLCFFILWQQKIVKWSNECVGIDVSWYVHSGVDWNATTEWLTVVTFGNDILEFVSIEIWSHAKRNEIKDTQQSQTGGLDSQNECVESKDISRKKTKGWQQSCQSHLLDIRPNDIIGLKKKIIRIFNWSCFSLDFSHLTQVTSESRALWAELWPQHTPLT